MSTPDMNPLDHHHPKPISSNMVPLHKRIRLCQVHGPKRIGKLPTIIYERYTVHKRIMGHLAPSYCVCFDQSGDFVFSGADDFLIKIWCSRTGRLVKTLRGHSGQVCDMSVDYDNRLLASVGQDKILRIWDLRSSALVRCLPIRSSITSVKFSPFNRHGDDRYLITTSNDGVVRIYSYPVDKPEDIELILAYRERNRPGGQLTCSSFSTGGAFLALGASDNAIHVYRFPHPATWRPYSITHPTAGLMGHEDKVDSIQFCNRGTRFISGSKDGTARIWSFRKNQWKSIILDMDTQLDQSIIRTNSHNPQKPPTVLIVQWSRDDRYVMTSLVDHSIKVWDSKTGRLVYILQEHKHDIYLLESHPRDARIFVSAGHDGYLCIWDLETGKLIKKINYNAQWSNGPDQIQLYDIKFSPAGDTIVTTDSFGYITFISTGSPDSYSQVPEHMFFNTDYRGVIRDANHIVADEHTNQLPHRLPRPQLVDMNGEPHPIEYQRLVPDHKCGLRTVIPPMKESRKAELKTILEEHSILEDTDYEYQRSLECTYDSDDTIDYATDDTEIYVDQELLLKNKYYRKRRYQTRSSGGPVMQPQHQERPNVNLRPRRAKRICVRFS